MPGLIQATRLDFLNNVKGHVVNFFKRRETFFSSPSDGLPLKLHYKHTFWMFMAAFCMVYYNWLTKDIIHCVSHYNAEVQVRADHLNMCLSYPFLVEGGRRTTLLYYRWFHWVLLLCALAYITPHKLAKITRYDKITKLTDFLSQSIPNYMVSEKGMIDAVCKHFATEVGGQNHIFIKYVWANLTALGINAAVFFALDAVLLGNFSHLGIDAFPLTVSRDGQFLNDPLARAFPPFVDCEIRDVHVLANKRDETYGCHLLAQEYYEKILLLVWYWMVLLGIGQALYILFLVCFMFKRFRQFLFKVILVFRSDSAGDLSSATMKFQIGDWFLLYKLRNCFYYDGFSILIKKLANREEMNRFENGAKQLFGKICAP